MIDLKRKVGPLPVWGYGAAAGAVGLFLFLRARSKSGSAATTDSGASQATQAQDGYGTNPWTGTPSSLGGPGSISYGQDNGPNPQQSPQGVTNLPNRVGYDVIYDPVLRAWRYSKAAVPKIGPGQRLSWSGTKYVVEPATSKPSGPPYPIVPVHAPLRP